MSMCASTCIRTSLLFHIHTHLLPYLYVYMFRLFCNDPLYPVYSNHNKSLCTCSYRLVPMLTHLWLHVQGSVFPYSSMSILPMNAHIACAYQKCSILCAPTPPLCAFFNHVFICIDSIHLKTCSRVNDYTKNV